MRKNDDRYFNHDDLSQLSSGTRINGEPVNQEKPESKGGNKVLLVVSLITILGLAVALLCMYIHYKNASEACDVFYAEMRGLQSDYSTLNTEYERISRLYEEERSERMSEIKELRYLEAKDEYWTSIDPTTRIHVFTKEDGKETQIETVFADFQEKAEAYAEEKTAVVNDPNLAPDMQGNAAVGGGANDDPGPGPYEPTPVVPIPGSMSVEESQYQPKADTYPTPTPVPTPPTYEKDPQDGTRYLPD